MSLWISLVSVATPPFLSLFFSVFYVHECFVWTCTTCVPCAMESEEGVKSLGTVLHMTLSHHASSGDPVQSSPRAAVLLALGCLFNPLFSNFMLWVLSVFRFIWLKVYQVLMCRLCFPKNQHYISLILYVLFLWFLFNSFHLLAWFPSTLFGHCYFFPWSFLFMQALVAGNVHGAASVVLHQF